MDSQNLILGFINRTLEAAVKESISSVAEEASEKIKKEVHALAPKVLLGIQETMSVSWDAGPTLTIRIEFKEPKKETK